MDPAQGTPVQPSGPSPASSLPQAPKIPIEQGRMQAIKEAFEKYKSAEKEASQHINWAYYKIEVSDQLSDIEVKALSGRILGAPATEDSLSMIDWLEQNGRIHQKTDELNALIENHFREKEPDEAVEPSPSDVKTKAQRREAITAAYQEYMDVDPANPENKVAAYNTFIDKVNEQMTVQEVKELALAHEAPASISDFKGFTKWLERQPNLSKTAAMLDGRVPSTVKSMMDTIFPLNKL